MNIDIGFDFAGDRLIFFSHLFSFWLDVNNTGTQTTETLTTAEILYVHLYDRDKTLGTNTMMIIDHQCCLLLYSVHPKNKPSSSLSLSFSLLLALLFQIAINYKQINFPINFYRLKEGHTSSRALTNIYTHTHTHR